MALFRQAFLRITTKEARVHAAIAATAGWTLVLAFLVAAPGARSLFGPLKWADFVHFYTLGDIARHGDASLLFDTASQHARQTELVPASGDDLFIPIYAPQTAIAFAPFALLPYLGAGALWAAVTLLVYGLVVWLAWYPARAVIADRRLVFLGAAGFPPLMVLVGYGQTTAFVLLAFGLGWRLYDAGHRFASGVVLSLLAIKPQFGLALAFVSVGAAEGWMVAGIFAGLALQALAVLAVFGAAALTGWARALSGLPALADLLEPRAYAMHSLAAWTGLLPEPFASALLVAAGAVVVAATLYVWRRTESSRVRFGTLVLASALINPHLSTYDTTVLVLPALWLGGVLLEWNAGADWFWQHAYYIAVFLFLPTAAIVRLQLSTTLMAMLFVRIVRNVQHEQPPPVRVKASGLP